jgi:hypothetical protein
MKPMEISGIAAAMTEAGYHAAVIATHDPDDVIFPVGDQQILLLWVVREIDRPGRPVAQGCRMNQEFLYELASFGEDLNAIVVSVADINQSIGRQTSAMHRVLELLV